MTEHEEPDESSDGREKDCQPHPDDYLNLDRRLLPVDRHHFQRATGQCGRDGDPERDVPVGIGRLSSAADRYGPRSVFP
nr:hypothetical protein [Actinomycetota bacterium]